MELEIIDSFSFFHEKRGQNFFNQSEKVDQKSTKVLYFFVVFFQLSKIQRKVNLHKKSNFKPK